MNSCRLTIAFTGGTYAAFVLWMPNAWTVHRWLPDAITNVLVPLVIGSVLMVFAMAGFTVLLGLTCSVIMTILGIKPAQDEPYPSKPVLFN